MSDLQDALDFFDNTGDMPPKVVYSPEQLVILEAAKKYANPDIKAVAGYLYGSHDYKAMEKARQVVSLALGIENK